MTNRSDFEFEEDPFADDNEGGFGGFDDDLTFDDDPGLDDLDSLDDLDDDDLAGDDEERGGPNRTFVILGAVIVIVILVAVGVILFLVSRPQGPTPIQLTSTRIAELNATTESQATATALQGTQDAAQTATALAIPTNTPTFTPTLTPSPSPTVESVLPTDDSSLPPTTDEAPVTTDEATVSPIVALTQTEQAAQQAQQNANASATAQAAGSGTPGVTGPISGDAVRLTATALFLTLNPPTPGGPTAAVSPVPGRTLAPPPQTDTSLPDTGIFDDIASGSNLTLALLMAVGLVGVIFVSRRLRR